MSDKTTSRNVTLPDLSSAENLAEISGKIFPCPICGNGLSVGLTFKRKPYCTCNDCGLQLFFRGRLGIERLRKLLSSGEFISGDNALAGDPLALINRMERLQIQKRDLEAKEGFILKNEAVSDAISAVDDKISQIKKELKKRAEKQGKTK